tara:strand:+ start:1775 stop:2650 length:876 start_codon:yes stop_codon:yes gene_type:complete
MFRIDCHFHPNFSFLSKYKIKKKAKKIWSKFKDCKLDIVICSEHNFKKPKEAYFELMKYKPKDHNTLLLPGVEATTKEGIDIILFSDSPSFYENHKDLLIPKLYSLDKFIKRIKQTKNIFSVVAHPNIIFNQGLLSNQGSKKYLQKIKDFDFIEKHNACLNELVDFLKIFKNTKFYNKILSVKNLPDKFVKNNRYLVGSDAHHVEDIGSFLEFPNVKNKIDIYSLKSLISSKEKRQIIFAQPKNKVLSFSKKVLTSFTEVLQSEIYNLKINKNLTNLKWQTEYMLKKNKSM